MIFSILQTSKLLTYTCNTPKPHVNRFQYNLRKDLHNNYPNQVMNKQQLGILL